LRHRAFFLSCLISLLLAGTSMAQQQPDIAVSLAQPQMSICAGAAPQSNAVRLQPLNNYNGTPQVEFVSVPIGVTISPNPLPPASLPPAREIPFTVAATAPGTHNIIVRVTDPQFGINRSVNFVLIVTAPDFTPMVTPSQIQLTAAGAPATVVASIAPNECLAQNVTVTAAAPPGITVTPQPQTIAPPYGPVSFTVQGGSFLRPVM
jgi:hypothetical protein